MNNYQRFIYKRTYSRFIEGRREEWPETVERYARYLGQRVPNSLEMAWLKASRAIERMEIMPSMRALWVAGAALESSHVAGYNCSYTTIEEPRDFAEILYILMCGAGVGFSVERQFISRLPVVPPTLAHTAHDICFEDSKEGWSKGFLALLHALYAGCVPTLDYSKLRPRGAVLKTFGGRASGPEPLRQLCDFTIALFKGAAGRRLHSDEVADIGCMIGECVVVGGVRRSSLIILSNLSDERMRHYKSGDWWRTTPWRSNANISTVYTEPPEMYRFVDEWKALMDSRSGERGIFNREMALAGARELDERVGTNPCGEIILRSKQFCNLSEIVVRPMDTFTMLERKAQHAVALGVVQATFTDFPFLSKEWKSNCEEERLLGVSLTGLCDHPVLGHANGTGERWLRALRHTVRDTAEHWAKRLSIEIPTAMTCVKPSGTVSQLVDSASGMHSRHAPYYIRRVRADSKDPLAQMMVDQGVPWDPEVGQDRETCTTMVFSFPQKAPSGAVTGRSAREQLEHWSMLKHSWCDHNPSCTISIADHEWLGVGDWVYQHWSHVGGLSFLPRSGTGYQLMPYEEIDKSQYDKLMAAQPEIDFTKLSDYEYDDATEGAKTYACTSVGCGL